MLSYLFHGIVIRCGLQIGNTVRGKALEAAAK